MPDDFKVKAEADVLMDKGLWFSKFYKNPGEIFRRMGNNLLNSGGFLFSNHLPVKKITHFSVLKSLLYFCKSIINPEKNNNLKELEY
ncbi:hypothetical protein EGI16_00440 [Chryseobacterium sp. G0240]|nr:hypothetical protein EGI16_00440 [Chryseobacterium sp. G0240]